MKDFLLKNWLVLINPTITITLIIVVLIQSYSLNYIQNQVTDNTQLLRNEIEMVRANYYSTDNLNIENLKGEQGIKGEKGEKGEKGDQGEKGLTGSGNISGYERILNDADVTTLSCSPGKKILSFYCAYFSLNGIPISRFSYLSDSSAKCTPASYKGSFIITCANSN